MNINTTGKALVMVAVVVGLMVLGLILGVWYSSGQNAELQMQFEKLQVENQTLQHNLDLASTPNDTEFSPEMEALNSIGQAIGNSKKTEIRIETKEGTFINFTYEAK